MEHLRVLLADDPGDLARRVVAVTEAARADGADLDACRLQAAGGTM
jgi:hypothetical protein